MAPSGDPTDPDGRGGHAARTVPLSAITDRRDLALRRRTPAAGPEPRVRWAVVSELADPARYLTGGELLLSAGVDMAADPARLRAYVAGLVASGVSALGFGVTPVYDTVPGALVEQCRAQGLPLLEVPERTPFVAVSQAVGQALEELHVQEARRLGEAHRALARAATAASPVDRLVRTLADALGCWAAVVPGGPADPETPPLSGEVAALAGRLCRPNGPRSAKARMGPDEVFLHGIGEPPERAEVLVIGRPAPFGGTDRAVLGTAVALLGLLPGGGAADPPWLPLTRLLLDSAPVATLAPLAAGLAGGSGTAFRVLHACRSGSGPDTAAPPERFGTALVDTGGPGGTVRAVVGDTGDRAAHWAHLRALHGRGWLGALSGPAGPEGLHRADRRAAALLERARSAGAPLIAAEHADPLDAAIAPEDAGAAAAAILGPLAGSGPDAQGLRRTLRAWLARHGNWGRAAGDLGAHRNSVRYRIGRVERDLGIDLGDPEERMRLWFALTRFDPGG
ncbi:PucR-like helix-turn-helix protein [Murinocardiopsis flavida]|uniref:PucR-like helix-turn-helix protein n=1 Tax=Murinocardiopsis flavida TaxID=645275 RepID=A0A2P8D991_9ACTN|nr:PucR family transcriptional regulator [Murinocardiopsis flavida]PSK93794.1 PucR-like helix-turn-helix protein [Murinocardiopsis flavida]